MKNCLSLAYRSSALFITCIALLFHFQTLAQAKKPIELDDIFRRPTFMAQTLQSLQSLKDGKSYVSVNSDQSGKYLAKNSYSTGQETGILFRERDLVYHGEQLEISSDFNEDESKVLLSKDEEPIYRYSFKANYFVFDLASKKITPVSTQGKQLYATFSPDGSKVAFVRDNNIFVKDLKTGNEKQITNDGKINHIINGRLDWVYEEEFQFERAFFWSRDGKRIAYYKMDESDVPEYSMTVFDKLYPTEYKYKYPKAGEKNAVVSIHTYDLTSGKTVTMDVGKEKDQYIPRIRWTSASDVLCILRMNRHQNKLEYLLADTKTGATNVILTEEDKYYVDVEREQLTFLDDGKHFLNVSERDGFNHIYLYTLDGRIKNQITKGNWEVTQVYGLDEKSGRVYYQSTERSPLRRDVYSINLNGSDKKQLSTAEGTNEANFSSDYSFYILSNSSINRPPVITLNQKGGKTLRTLADNQEVVRAMRNFDINPFEFFRIKTSSNVELNAYMVKPPNFSATKKYPVLMYVYGGPGSQNVADSWGGARPMWHQLLAQKGYIVVCVDNRGTGFRGAEFKKMTYKELGKYETIDQIESAKWLAQQSFVDATRIGIWGWSYGGYMSSLCITKGADVFKMAMAVAPVTTWRFYDTIYTERYLRTPQENPEGYDQNSPINYADRLKGKFLLVHGTGDDNVHFQNSVMFSEALIQANKPFEQAYYPNKAHGISGGNASIHLYSKMTDFVINNL
jgi:dipeptidyl-peptidase 4